MSILTIGTSRKLYRTCNILQNINIPTYLTGLQIRSIFGGIWIQQIGILKTGSELLFFEAGPYNFLS